MSRDEKLLANLDAWKAKQRKLETELSAASTSPNRKNVLTDELLTIEVHIGRLEEVLGVGS